MRKPMSVSKLPDIDGVWRYANRLPKRIWHWLRHRPKWVWVWLAINIGLAYVLSGYQAIISAYSEYTLHAEERLMTYVFFGLAQMLNLLSAFVYRTKMWLFILTIMLNVSALFLISAFSIIFALMDLPVMIHALVYFVFDMHVAQQWLNFWYGLVN